MPALQSAGQPEVPPSVPQAAVDLGWGVRLQVDIPAETVTGDHAKQVNDETPGYTYKQAWNFLDRLKKNNKRFAGCSDALRELIDSKDDATRKRLFGMVMETKGDLTDLEVTVTRSVESVEANRDFTQLLPVTDQELDTMYGSRAAEVKAHKIRVGEVRSDPNLPGSYIYLVAKHIIETGEEERKRHLP